MSKLGYFLTGGVFVWFLVDLGNGSYWAALVDALVCVLSLLCARLPESTP